jgi:hypothetical protein
MGKSVAVATDVTTGVAGASPLDAVEGGGDEACSRQYQPPPAIAHTTATTPTTRNAFKLTSDRKTA